MKRFLLLALAGVAFAAAPARAANPVILIETSMGNIKVELFEDKAPKTVKNILGYVDDKFYDNTIFHRVISNFMIQCGGFESGMKQKKGKDPIVNESDNNLSNERGTLAMARTSEPNSASSQFFINVKDNTFLDKAKARDKVGYCVFGKVIDGMDVVDKIKAVETADQGGHENVPKKDVVIKSIRRIDK
ncbi:MAG: peptidyl-prolyl cis-trans isomerase [Gemmataceae bacterium]|nr:peptidyl-prolyl cis-trans isomerase [Gemmataceae bacterium]